MTMARSGRYTCNLRYKEWLSTEVDHGTLHNRHDLAWSILARRRRDVSHVHVAALLHRYVLLVVVARSRGGDAIRLGDESLGLRALHRVLVVARYDFAGVGVAAAQDV